MSCEMSVRTQIHLSERPKSSLKTQDTLHVGGVLPLHRGALEEPLHGVQKRQYRKQHQQALLNLSSSDSTFSGNPTISYFSVRHYIISPACEHAHGRLRNRSGAEASDERDTDQQMLPFQKVSVDQLSAPASVSADERVRKHVRKG